MVTSSDVDRRAMNVDVVTTISSLQFIGLIAYYLPNGDSLYDFPFGRMATPLLLSTQPNDTLPVHEQLSTSLQTRLESRI